MSDYDDIIKLDTRGRGYNLYYDSTMKRFIACLGDYIKFLELEMVEGFVFIFVINRDNNNKVFLCVDDSFCEFDIDNFELEMVSDNTEDLCKEVLASIDIDAYIKSMIRKHYDRLVSENKEMQSRLESELQVTKDIVLNLELLKPF